MNQNTINDRISTPDSKYTDRFPDNTSSASAGSNRIIFEDVEGDIEVSSPSMRHHAREMGYRMSQTSSHINHLINEKASELKHQISHRIDRLSDSIRNGEYDEMLHRATTSIRQHPMRAALITAGAGLGLAMLMKSRRSHGLHSSMHSSRPMSSSDQCC